MIRIIPFIVFGNIRIRLNQYEIFPDIYFSIEELKLCVDFLIFRIEIQWAGWF